MYICICNAVTERDIERCVRSRTNCSLEDLQQELGVAAGCGCCREAAAAVLAERAQTAVPGMPRRKDSLADTVSMRSVA